jgi:hypothetical protein
MLCENFIVRTALKENLSIRQLPTYDKLPNIPKLFTFPVCQIQTQQLILTVILSCIAIPSAVLKNNVKPIIPAYGSVKKSHMFLLYLECAYMRTISKNIISDAVE